MPATRTAELASRIAENIERIDAYTSLKDTPPVSFDASASDFPLYDQEIDAARQVVLDATDELHALMLGPVGMLTSPSHNFLISLQAICRFGLANAFPDGKDEATFDEIASISGLGESYVRRILRHAMTYRIFCEPRKGLVAHTSASKHLATDLPTRQWIGMIAEEMWPAAAGVGGAPYSTESESGLAYLIHKQTVEAMVKWPGSEEPTHSGFNLAHNTSETVFAALSRSPMRAERYAAAMSWFSTGPGLEMTHILEALRWESLVDGVVVDVGGSYGSICVTLARNHPSLKFIVQDRPEVIVAGRQQLPQELDDRVTFLEHDFFDDQPVRGADVYILRWILHDWSDQYAIKILRALIPALKEGAKVLINEIILPEPGSSTPYHERKLRSFDMAMLEFHNGKERDMDDWRQLFISADPNYHILGVTQPAGSRLGFIEVGWRTAET